MRHFLVEVERGAKIEILAVLCAFQPLNHNKQKWFKCFPTTTMIWRSPLPTLVPRHFLRQNPGGHQPETGVRVRTSRRGRSRSRVLRLAEFGRGLARQCVTCAAGKKNHPSIQSSVVKTGKNLGTNASPTWHAISNSKSVFVKHTCFFLSHQWKASGNRRRQQQNNTCQRHVEVEVSCVNSSLGLDTNRIDQ